jgi:hypothetical protein
MAYAEALMEKQFAGKNYDVVRTIEVVNSTDAGWNVETANMGLLVSRPILANAPQAGPLNLAIRSVGISLSGFRFSISLGDTGQISCVASRPSHRREVHHDSRNACDVLFVAGRGLAHIS